MICAQVLGRKLDIILGLKVGAEVSIFPPKTRYR